MEGHFITCGYCHKQFFICKHCFRGHRYCSDGCRKHGYELRRRIARKKYALSPEAKADHRDRNKFYRIHGPKKFFVMDKSSALEQKLVNAVPQTEILVPRCCICCGVGPVGVEFEGYKTSLLLPD